MRTEPQHHKKREGGKFRSDAFPPDGGEQLNYGMVDVTPTAFFHQTHHHHPILTGDDNDELPPPFPFLPPSPSFTTPHLAGDDDNRNDASARYVSTSFLSAPSIATTATIPPQHLSSFLPLLRATSFNRPAPLRRELHRHHTQRMASRRPT